MDKCKEAMLKEAETFVKEGLKAADTVEQARDVITMAKIRYGIDVNFTTPSGETISLTDLIDEANGYT